MNEFNKEEALKKKAEIDFKLHKQKLVAPNENYEVAICRNCGTEFIKRLNNSTKQLSPGIRGWRAMNCSKKCTRESKRSSLFINKKSGDKK